MVGKLVGQRKADAVRRAIRADKVLARNLWLFPPVQGEGGRGQRLTGADDKQFHLLVWLGLVAAIPVAAMVTYHLVERPARKALRGFADRRAARAAATLARTNSPDRGLQPPETIV
jgi:hypothetical protein